MSKRGAELMVRLKNQGFTELHCPHQGLKAKTSSPGGSLLSLQVKQTVSSNQNI